jgi:hypothetical protein
MDGVGARRRGVRHTAAQVLRDPVIDIMALAAFFDGLSGNLVHAILLFSVAVALARDAVVRPHAAQVPGSSSEPTRSPLGSIPRGALILGALAYAVVVGGFPQYSWPITAAVIILGTGGLVLAWGRSRQPASDPGKLDPVGAVAWVSAFVGLATFELINFLLQPSLTGDSYAHPTLSVLSDPFLATYLGRAVALFLWLLLGWFLVDR